MTLLPLLQVYLTEGMNRRFLLKSREPHDNNSFVERKVSLDPAGTFSFQGIQDNSMLIISSTEIINVALTTASGSLTFDTKLFVFDSTITQLVITNTGQSIAEVNLLNI